MQLSLTQLNSFPSTCEPTSFAGECLGKKSTAQRYRFKKTPAAQISRPRESCICREHLRLLYFIHTNIIRF